MCLACSALQRPPPNLLFRPGKHSEMLYGVFVQLVKLLSLTAMHQKFYSSMVRRQHGNW